LAFFTLLGLTILLIGASVAFSVFIPNPTKTQTGTENDLFHAGTYTLTALVGLLTGKIA
jgi:hypothetical protein